MEIFSLSKEEKEELLSYPLFFIPFVYVDGLLKVEGFKSLEESKNG